MKTVAGSLVLVAVLAAPVAGQSAIGILSEKENKATLESIEREQAHLVSLPLTKFKKRSFGWLRLTPGREALVVEEHERILEVAAKKATVEPFGIGWKIASKKRPKRMKAFFEAEEKRRSVVCDLAELPEDGEAHFGVFFVVGGYYCLMRSPDA